MKFFSVIPALFLSFTAFAQDFSFIGDYANPDQTVLHHQLVISNLDILNEYTSSNLFEDCVSFTASSHLPLAHCYEANLKIYDDKLNQINISGVFASLEDNSASYFFQIQPQVYTNNWMIDGNFLESKNFLLKDLNHKDYIVSMTSSN